MAGASGPFGHSELEYSDNDETELLSVSWNQDYICFATGKSRSFHKYTTDPFKETFKANLKSGGFGMVEMLYECQILALVGGKGDAEYSPNKVIIWNDNESQCIGNLKLLHQIETLANPKGLCCLSHQMYTFVLACPGLQQVQVEAFGLNMAKLIKAHDSHISCFTLTLDGLLLATASIRGFFEVQWMALSSDKGIVQIFSLRVRMDGEGHLSTDPGGAKNQSLCYQNSFTLLEAMISPRAGANPSSALSFMKGVLPKYFSSETSFAQFHLPESAQIVAASGSHKTIIFAGMDSRYKNCSFDPVNGGEMVQQEYFHFLKIKRRPR